MASTQSRIDVQRNAENSSVKQFLQDQLGLLFTIVGGIPIFYEYFGLIDKPSTVSESALRAISLTSLLISSMLILFIYGERRHLIKDRRMYSVVLGVLLMAAGLVLLAGYVYKPTTESLLFEYRSANKYHVYMYGPSEKADEPLNRVGIDQPIAVTLVSYITSLSFAFIWILAILYLIYEINYRIQKANQNALRQTNGTFNVGVNPVSVSRKLLSLVPTILIFIFISSLIAYPIIKLSTEHTRLIISVRMLNIIRTGAYIFYYPLLVMGIVLMATVVFNSFENRRNFYQNINELSEPFYNEIERMTFSLNQFENWFNRLELIYREDNLLKPSESTNQSTDEIAKATIREEQRQFFWRVMHAKAHYYRQRIEEFAVSENRILSASGGLIDEIFEYVPSGRNILKEFKAVSSGDIKFWQKRGEEYLRWNIDMIKQGVQVTRIFLINRSPEYFTGKDPEESKANYGVLFSQIIQGFRTYICYEEDFIANDGTQFGLNRNDFGVYPDFAVSFFAKPLRVGGRSLLMVFDPDIIQDYTNLFNEMLSKIENKECFSLDKEILKIDGDVQMLKETSNVLRRIDAMETFLLNTYFTKFGSPTEGVIKDREDRIKVAAARVREIVNKSK
ncbi:hypothetical protein [Spirosoma endophyticum]|uniref:Uncharacterized protein n=1 Tax=Spirosoma endophyticum TaxID=662367 RepID=A0A1I2GDI4_9BACT|nr:hypothetical protein [Spirosoma endophyticum]SFF15562.1 hypothetical protein SAMN05216167_13146 [Spirosoma endophyticum]